MTSQYHLDQPCPNLRTIPVTGYQVFFLEYHRNNIKQGKTIFKAGEICRLPTRAWQELSEDQRDKYQEQAHENCLELNELLDLHIQQDCINCQEQVLNFFPHYIFSQPK